MGAGRTAAGDRPARRPLLLLALLLLAFLATPSLSPEPAAAACTRFVPQELQFVNGAQVRTRRANRSAVVMGRVRCEDARPATSGTVVMSEYVHIPSTGQFLGYNGQSVSLTPHTQGEFVFEVAPGPSRVLYFTYVHPGGAYSSLSPQHLVLNMAARPKMKAGKNHRRVGQKTEFVGSIPSYFVGGRPSIALQAKSGRKWRTFKVVPVNPAGKFRAVYRFTQTSRPTVYRFRAKIVKSGTEYPFITRTSRKSRVRVRP
jgi:hypothetical protein